MKKGYISARRIRKKYQRRWFYIGFENSVGTSKLFDGPNELARGQKNKTDSITSLYKCNKECMESTYLYAFR